MIEVIRIEMHFGIKTNKCKVVFQFDGSNSINSKTGTVFRANTQYFSSIHERMGEKNRRKPLNFQMFTMANSETDSVSFLQKPIFAL